MNKSSENCCGDSEELSNNHYDLAVIGAGSAGFSAAISAAEKGAKVALIGYGTIGGSCVNVGCVPSKTLIRATETLHQAKMANRFTGVQATGSVSDWAQLVEQKDELVSELRSAKYVDLLPTYDSVSYLEGKARLTEGGVLVDGKMIEAGKIIIATGSHPSTPDIDGIAGISLLSSTEAMDLVELPRSLMVIGGGYIGCELAQVFARAGVEVTIVCRSRLLPQGEPEISEALSGFFGEEGIRIVDGVIYRDISQTDEGVVLRVTRSGEEMLLETEAAMSASGRTANTKGLGLSEAGVELNTDGGIMVDECMRTSRKDIFAAGDVTGRDQFVYMAAYGARIAAMNAVNGAGLCYDNKAMPEVVFTDPQSARVGLSEAEARSQGLEVKTSVLPLKNVPRALAARDTRGLIKLVADAQNNRLIGAHILAPEGGDSIQTAAMAIQHNMTYDELGAMIFPYLTTVEGLKLAAQAFEKDVAKLSCCAG